MKAKYYNYWDNPDKMNFLLHIVLVLDPQNKMFYSMVARMRKSIK